MRKGQRILDDAKYTTRSDARSWPLLTSTSSQEQQSVELIKEKGRRLMNGDEHGLSSIGELSEESKDVERGLSVKTRGGL